MYNNKCNEINRIRLTSVSGGINEDTYSTSMMRKGLRNVHLLQNSDEADSMCVYLQIGDYPMKSVPSRN
jgi:hypothetical protein